MKHKVTKAPNTFNTDKRYKARVGSITFSPLGTIIHWDIYTPKVRGKARAKQVKPK